MAGGCRPRRRGKHRSHLDSYCRTVIKVFDGSRATALTHGNPKEAMAASEGDGTPRQPPSSKEEEDEAYTPVI